jgi:hypothetical protein
MNLIKCLVNVIARANHLVRSFIVLHALLLLASHPFAPAKKKIFAIVHTVPNRIVIVPAMMNV